MYSIGEFAKRCQTSITEIRFYDNKGILPADEISPENGRRYYSEESVLKYRQIQRLQEAGFTLTEIQEYLLGDQQLSGQSFFEQKKQGFRQKIALLEELERENVLDFIKPKNRYVKPSAKLLNIKHGQVAEVLDAVKAVKGKD